jgi:CheY-like chemotaxis protein
MSQQSIILHVEDDPNDVMLVELIHRKGKFASRLQVVGDGEEAVGYLAGKGAFTNRSTYPLPNLVLLDLKLPKKSGLEVLQWVRSNQATRRLPVLMLTSSNQQEDIKSAYDLGANSYLMKPSDLDSLATMLKTIHDYWLGMNQAAVLELSL